MTNDEIIPSPKHSQLKVAIKIIETIVTLVLLELVVFNYSAIDTRNLTPVELDLSQAQIDGNSVVITDLKLDDVETITLKFSGSNEITYATIEAKDDSSRNAFVLRNSVQISAASMTFSKETVLFHGNGTIYEIRIKWRMDDALNTVYDSSTIDYGVSLEQITVNDPIPYKVYFPRLIFLLIICVSLILFNEYHLWDIRCDFQSLKHQLVYGLFALVCVFCALCVFNLSQPYDRERFIYTQEINYPFEKDIFEYRQATHSVMFDSLYNGVAYVRTENGDGVIDESVNIYDPSLRSTDHFWFDYVQHEGKVYFYFGVAPTLLFYFPYFFFTGRLPSYLQSGLFFSVLCIIAGFMCVWTVARRYASRINLIFLGLISSAVVLGTNVLMLQSCSDRYYLSIMSMQAFFFLVVWSVVSAENAQHMVKKRIYLSFCAVFCLLLVWSRPIGALCVIVWLIPLFIRGIATKQLNIKEKIGNILSFGIPITIFGLLAMYWNYIRFGSCLEFGVKWQLTIEDCQNKGLAFSNAVEAIFHYFFSGVSFNSRFPWVRGMTNIENHTGNYLYSRVINGVFTLPITWGVFLFCTQKSKYDNGREIKIISIASIIMSMAIALIDFSMCGITERYVCDILPLIGLVSGIAILRLCSEDSFAIRRIIIFLCVSTYIVAICLSFSNYRNFIALYSPEKYIYVARMLNLY